MKGQWKTVEAVMGGIIILLFLAALGASQAQVSSRTPAHSYRSLEAAYHRGDLRAMAAGLDCSGVDGLLESTGYLTGYTHSVMICDSGGSCCGSIPSAGDVWTSSMLLAGNEVYDPVEVILYVSKD